MKGVGGGGGGVEKKKSEEGREWQSIILFF